MAAGGGAETIPPTSTAREDQDDEGVEEKQEKEEKEEEDAEEDTPCSDKTADRRRGKASRSSADQTSANNSRRPPTSENSHDRGPPGGKGKYNRNGSDRDHRQGGFRPGAAYDRGGTAHEKAYAKGGYDRGYDRGYERGKGFYEDQRKGWGKGHFNDFNGNNVYGAGSASSSRKGAETIGTKLYVGNLPHDITRDALEIVFSTYGRLEDVHIMTGRSKSGKSCAFVLYFDPQDAKSAIVAMQVGYEICPGEGDIIVKFADSSKHQGFERGRDAYEDKGKGWGKDAYDDQRKGWGDPHQFNGRSSGNGFGAAGVAGGRRGLEALGTKLYVGNLPHDITRYALEVVFSTYGRLEDVHIMSGRSKSGNSCAFVLYFDPQDASTAIAAMQAGYEIRPGEGNIIVKLADSSKGKKGKAFYENY